MYPDRDALLDAAVSVICTRETLWLGCGDWPTSEYIFHGKALIRVGNKRYLVTIEEE